MLAIARVLRMGARCCSSTSPPRAWHRSSSPGSARSSASQGRGVGVLLIEQNVKFAATVADRHYLLSQGRIVETLDNPEFQQPRRAPQVPRHLAAPPHDHLRHARTRRTHAQQEIHHRGPGAADRLLLAACGEGGPSAGAAISPAARSCSRCSTTSPASTRTCPDPTPSRRSRWPSPTTRRSTATRRSRRTSRSSADHQNKPDIANTKAQELYDRQGADVILDVPTSSAALAVATQAKTQKKLFIDVSAAPPN